MKSVSEDLFIKTFGDEKNPPIVFVHGFPFDHKLWDNQVDILKEKYFCISYDIRGLGRSEVGDGQFTMEKFSNDLIHLVKNLKLNKPVLCGMSMGGYIILRALQKEQELFAGVILIDTKSAADNDIVKLKRAEAIDSINSMGLIKFNKNFITPLFWDKTINSNMKLVNQIISRANKANPLGVKGALIAMLSRIDTTGYLKELNVPALVLCGKYDNLTTPEEMKSLADEIPNSKFFVVPKASHMAPVENPEFVNKKITSFLAKVK